MPFDLEGARGAGWSDKEIIDHLREKSPGFDIDGARKAGYDDDELVKYLTTGQGYDRSPFGIVGAVPRGINTGLAKAFGAPVDLVNAGLGALGVPVSDAPLGGSESFKTLLDQPGRAAKALTGGDPDSGPRATYDRLDDLPPEERIGAVGGEVLGASVPFAAAPLAVARVTSLTRPAMQPGNIAQTLTRPIMEGARNTPGRFLAAEGAMAGGAAQAAAGAQALFPGNEAVRTGAEIVGAVANPTGTLVRGGGAAAASVRNFASGFTPGGTQRRAEEYIARAFQQTGEDPGPVISALRQADEMGLNLTSAQKSGSPTAMAIESRIGRDNPVFGRDRDIMAREAMETLRTASERLAASGDPEMLRRAAQLRAHYFDGVMSARLAEADQAAAAAMQTLSRGQDGGADASRRAYEVMDEAIKDVRKIEGELWGFVPHKTPVEPSSTLAAYDTVRKSMLREESLPGVFENVISRLKREESVPAQEINILRSRALERARELRAAQQWSDARMLQGLADGALDDLLRIDGSDAAEVARQFSRNLNERFSQTFAGRALGVDKTGGQRIAPEILLDRAFGGGARRGEVQMRQLQEASTFSDEATGTSDYGPQMAESQEQYLRSRAGEMANPETGVARPEQMARFTRDNPETLQRFPEVRQDVDRAAQSQRRAETLHGRGERASQVLPSSSPLGRLLKAGSEQEVVSTVSQALRSGPREYTALANLARKEGQEALDGLGAATLDGLMSRARSGTGTFSFARFGESLTRPASARSKSPLELMQETGTVSPGHAERLQTVIERGQQLELGDTTAREISQLIDSPDALTDFITRVVGANIGGASVVGKSAGAPIVAAGAGSRAARNLFQKVPVGKINEALIKITRDPELFAAALERNPAPPRRREIARQINAAMVQAGIIQDEEGEDTAAPEETRPNALSISPDTGASLRMNGETPPQALGIITLDSRRSTKPVSGPRHLGNQRFSGSVSLQEAISSPALSTGAGI